MGFFSGIRRKVKKFIPKEIRPFVPYIAAGLSGPIGAKIGMSNGMGLKALLAGGTRFLSDDEADLKDVAITSALAAAPSALESYGNQNMIGSEFAKSAAGKMVDAKGLPTLTTLGAQGAIDAGIKAAELNEDALDKYNRELLEQGINDKAGRRAAIRAIYSGTGTWDMDEVDGMLDTYGYRTGGRVGYAMGDRVDTEQIIEDFQRIPSMGKGIGNLARAGVDNIDKIIEVIINTNPMLATGDKIVEILIDRYGVDPEVAQRKVINRMSDANEGFGPQGPQGTPDEGYNPNIGIDSGAEDYYGETPAMPENLGDMGGNMDDMSGNSILNRLRRGQEIMPRPDRLTPVPMPTMPRDPDRLPPVPMPTMPRDPRYFDNRAEFKKGGKAEKFDESDFYNSFQYAKEGLESLEEAEDEIKPLPIRELRLADGGRVSELKEHYRKYLEMARKDGSKKIIPFEIFAEEFARENFARGGDVMDINMEEQIDTPSGDIMMDENVEVASNPEVMDSLNELSLMLFRRPLDQLSDDEYEELKDFAGQTSLKPGLIDEYKNYKMGQEDAGQPVLSPRDYFEMDRGAARMGVKKGGRVGKNQGGLMSMGGNEMDLRGGGFVPMGKAERADDVPARLSKNEFVMTADAVRAAGGGSVQKGADLMYDQMKQLEGQA